MLGTPVSQEVVDLYYDNDFDKHVEETLHVCENNNIDFDSLPENAQHTLVDMCFNLGANRLGKFRNMLYACSVSDWNEILDKWKILDGTVKLVEEVSSYKNKFWS